MSDELPPTAVAPGPPTEAREVFGDALSVACRYADLLATVGVERGLVGPREGERVWERHLLNCAAVASLVPAGRVVDLGSGAGLPGLVLAMLLRDREFVLLDATRRRTEFLTETARELHLDNVTVLWGRAEESHGLAVDTVVSRAVAPLDRLARWSSPLLLPGGVFLAMKGATAWAEVEQHSAAVRRAGILVDGVRECVVAGGESTYVVVGRRRG